MRRANFKFALRGKKGGRASLSEKTAAHKG
jgi:hypothetical protein